MQETITRQSSQVLTIDVAGDIGFVRKTRLRHCESIEGITRETKQKSCANDQRFIKPVQLFAPGLQRCFVPDRKKFR
jgi:hypothetical protein